ncbi:NlpC/P60 family protein [Limosilactobacillus reuteri]|uniref:NlpC/P60 family protein n=1 Tax=Limosilactobacillus reuteri TaxID=1598 RepID=UPI001C566F10|nr:NlpC/P60 family protein [Limosilactobacillus reuteri]MBW3349178.1 C40 family peptidase [Limosilactobacillus reuteri]UUW67937.1 NlpC/P60 family protein [Limosilactobacillus reuteri]
MKNIDYDFCLSKKLCISFLTCGFLLLSSSGIISADTINGNQENQETQVTMNTNNNDGVRTTTNDLEETNRNNLSVENNNKSEASTSSINSYQLANSASKSPTVNGIMNQNGQNYYYLNGQKQTNYFLNQDGKVYYFDNDGAMYQNKWYYNWGHAYYFKNDGSRAANETLNINNVTYTFDSEGIASSNKASQIVSIATQQLGKPYVWGATGPNSFDCSGLVQYVYKQIGINLPRTTYQQEYQGKAVSLNELQPGDLLFWGNYGSAYHVAIYIGNGNFIQAPTSGQSVKITNMNYYRPNFARRIL